MAEPNAFASLLPTPDNLADRREARFNTNPGDSFWAIEAGRAGLDLRRSLTQQGIAMSPEDQRAITAQAIIGGAQKRLAELVKAGTMDPLDAQEQVLTDTMSAFMQSGDWEAAQAMLPGLNQIRTYKDEQAKLRSETSENVADEARAYAAETKDLTSAAAQVEELPSKIAERQANATLRIAGANLKDRTDPNIRSGSGGNKGGVEIPAAERREVREMGASAMTLFQAMNDLSNYAEQSPFVMSAGAAGAAEARSWIQGAKSLFAKRGAAMGGFAAMSDRPEDGREGVSPKTIVKANRSQTLAIAARLGITDVASFESLVIDAAYAVARANDPGGRLSNNDFDQALKMLGAVQDPVAAKKAFKSLADRAVQKYRNRRKTYNPDSFEEAFGDMDKNVESDYNEFVSRWGSRMDSKEGTPPGSVDKDGWQTLQDGTRIRKKAR